MTEASVCWVAAPRQERLPPHTLRVTTAGRMACSARQLVASMAGLRRNVNSAFHSVHPGHQPRPPSAFRTVIDIKLST